ncbi:DUF3825 domain-containing protein [Candidatus Avelusimicrobium sp.]
MLLFAENVLPAFEFYEWEILQQFAQKETPFTPDEKNAIAQAIATTPAVSMENEKYAAVDTSVVCPAYSLGAYPQTDLPVYALYKHIPCSTYFHPNGRWSFQRFETLPALQRRLQGSYIGPFVFKNRYKAEDFLEILRQTAQEETWSLPNERLSSKILRNYLDNLWRLCQEKNQLLYSANKDYVLFDTNLFHRTFLIPIYIVAKVEYGSVYTDAEVITNGWKQLSKFGFDKQTYKDWVQQQKAGPRFYKNSREELLFNPAWEVDVHSDGKLTHILQERQERFFKHNPKLQDMEPFALQALFEKAIEISTDIAKRNYKFIAPQYRWQTREIQFLMPLFLLKKSLPDAVLVLSAMPKDQTYFPETILELQDAYQNARLIARPEDLWLRAAADEANAEEDKTTEEI